MIKLTDERCVEYIWFGEECLKRARLEGTSGSKVILDNRLLIICKFNPIEATLIAVQQGNFICHPKTGSLKSYLQYDEQSTLQGPSGGGFVNKDGVYQETSNFEVYTLVDDDQQSFVVSIDDTTLETEWAGAGNGYGNLYWIGQGDNPRVLSWRGPPNVQFPVPLGVTLSGFSQPRGGSTSVFGQKIYQDGKTLVKCPQIDSENPTQTVVVGACYATDSKGVEYLLCFSVGRLGSATYLVVSKSTNQGENWTTVRNIQVSETNLQAFISQSGKKFVYSRTLYQINDDLTNITAIQQGQTNSNITRTVVGKGGYDSSYTYSGTNTIWPTLKDDNLSITTVSTQANFSSSGTSDYVEKKITVPVFTGNPATAVTITNEGAGNPCEGGSDEGYVVTFAAHPNGNYCSVNWSGVDCFNGLMAKKVIPNCNSSYSVTVSLSPNGVSASYSKDEVLQPLIITGPQNSGNHAYPGIGEGSYGTQNSVGTVTWATSCGTITQSGQATFTGCGCPTATATITASDECGRTATLEVITNNSGYWVNNNDKCCFSSPVPENLAWMHCHSADEGSSCDSYTEVSGVTRIQYDIMPAWLLQLTTWEELCGSLCGSGENRSMLKRTTYSWRCL